MPNPQLTATNSAHFDANQVPSITGVIGTLGTADVQGTAAPLPFAVDPANGAQYTEVLSGTFANSLTGLVNFSYDNVVVTYPSGTSELYTFKTSTTPSGTITLNYTDTTKGSLSSVVRSWASNLILLQAISTKQGATSYHWLEVRWLVIYPYLITTSLPEDTWRLGVQPCLRILPQGIWAYKDYISEILLIP